MGDGSVCRPLLYGAEGELSNERRPVAHHLPTGPGIARDTCQVEKMEISFLVLLISCYVDDLPNPSFRERLLAQAEQTQGEDEEEEVRTEREQELGAEAVCTRMLCALCKTFVCPINEAVVGVGGGVSGPAWLPGSILSCRC
ncbi:hypothetical protein F7725_018204 [Dissostichus mawsoni]|uniref:Uncharacterized protein n=1 Tax=Dissostichus mawsoni TaxID=36200 RepID=A0A7J5XSF0_DISMA|nr:hypothetical protein F7725_018204 [Dissostichus mawsoni]